MKEISPEILEMAHALILGNGKILVRRKEASRILDCDVRTFQKQYVETGIVTAIYPNGSPFAKYDVRELLRAPDILRHEAEYREAEEAKKKKHKKCSFDELFDRTMEECLLKTGGNHVS